MRAIFTLAMTTAMTAAAFAGNFQTDTFKTKEDKAAKITPIEQVADLLAGSGIDVWIRDCQ